MSYRSLGQYTCDGCKVIQSSEIETASDMIGPMPPDHWLEVRTTITRGELIEHKHHQYCPSCSPLIASYLNGRAANDGGHA